MGELVVAIFTVITAFMVHCIVWKVRIPQRQTRTINIIFYGFLTLTITFLSDMALNIPLLSLHTPLHLSSYLHIVTFVTAITIAYIISYGAIEMESPSLLMVRVIGKAGTAGMSVSELNEIMYNYLSIELLIVELLNDRMIRLDGTVYRLTLKGVIMTRLILLHRKFFGLGKGG